MVLMCFFLISCGPPKEGEVYGGMEEGEYRNQWRYYDQNNQYRGRGHHEEHHHEHHEGHHESQKDH
jgi:hypothetical protein